MKLKVSTMPGPGGNDIEADFFPCTAEVYAAATSMATLTCSNPASARRVNSCCHSSRAIRMDEAPAASPEATPKLLSLEVPMLVRGRNRRRFAFVGGLIAVIRQLVGIAPRQPNRPLRRALAGEFG